MTNIPSAGSAVSLTADSIATDLLFSSCREITLLCFQAITLITHVSFYLKKNKKTKLGLALGSKHGDRVTTADMFSQFLPNKLPHRFVVFHPDGCHSNLQETKTHPFVLGLAARPFGRCIHEDPQDSLISRSLPSTRGL